MLKIIHSKDEMGDLRVKQDMTLKVGFVIR